MTRTADPRSSAPGTGRRVEFVRFHVGGLLVAFDDDEWLEITVWDEVLPREPASSDGAGIAFVDTIAGPRTEIVGQETGELALVDPLTPPGTNASPTSTRASRA